MAKKKEIELNKVKKKHTAKLKFKDNQSPSVANPPGIPEINKLEGAILIHKR